MIYECAELDRDGFLVGFRLLYRLFIRLRGGFKAVHSNSAVWGVPLLKS